MVRRAGKEEGGGDGCVLRPAPLLSVRSVCRWLNKSKRWVLGMVQASHRNGGPWVVAQVGRNWRIEEESVRAWLKRTG